MTTELYVHPKTEYQQLVDWLLGKPLRPKPVVVDQVHPPSPPAEQPAQPSTEEDSRA